MPIAKLASAFENQFFTSIQQIEMLEPVGKNSSSDTAVDTLPDLDVNGKPKRVF